MEKGKLGYLIGDSKKLVLTNFATLWKWMSRNSIMTAWLINSLKPCTAKDHFFLANF